MAKLTPECVKFLSTLNPTGKPTGGWNIPTATRAQDKARTTAKKQGWAVFDRKAWAWRITEAGRAEWQAELNELADKLARKGATHDLRLIDVIISPVMPSSFG